MDNLESKLSSFLRGLEIGKFVYKGKKSIRFHQKCSNLLSNDTSFKIGYTLSSFFRGHISYCVYRDILGRNYSLDDSRKTKLIYSGPSNYIKNNSYNCEINSFK